MDALTSYARHSVMTDPGAQAGLLRGIPEDPRELRLVPQRVTMHYRRAEAHGVDTGGRRDEARTRRVDALLAQISELDPLPITEERIPERKLIGHCRTSAVLMVSLLRQQGRSARARAVFSAYWDQKMRTDHWVAEHWDAKGQRWVITDADLDAYMIELGALTFDPNDVPRDQVVSAGAAWRLLRSGQAEDDEFGGDPDSYGLEYVRGHLLRDVAALLRFEVGPWDRWGLSALGAPSTDQLDALDQLARLSADGDIDQLRRLYAGDVEVQVPPAILEDDAGGRAYMIEVPDIWRDQDSAG